MSIQELSIAKHALLQRRLRGKPKTLAEPPAIPRRPKQTLAPLSFGQSRFWFLDQWEPGSPLHTIVRIFALSGPLDIAALEHALNTLVERHESLRTTFQVIEGAPIQLIAAARPLQVQLVDLQHLPEVEREAAARRLATEIARQPFDLEQGPLVRATLLRLGQQQYTFLLAMHHIISDGWSIGVFFRELKTCYAAHRAGAAALLPELPIQYADFAHWQRQRLQGDILAGQLAYWRRQLAGAPALLELPTDRPRPPAHSYRGAGQSFTLPETLTAALNELSRQAGATLFMTMLAAFQTLLARYTGQDDIVVGAPIANRTHVELEGLIGFCVNTLALRTDLSGNPTFRELLGRVREVALGAYAHQDVPFEKIVEELQPERNLSHQPLFQVMFVLQNTPPATLELDELTLSLVGDENATAKLDLMLFIEETPRGLVGQLRYKTDLFDAPTIARMAGHFETLLHEIAADADRPIAMLPLLTDAERRQMAEWNATQAEYPTDRCFQQLFAAQAARTPDAVALVYREQQLTYCELNQRANQLAHYLRTLGVGPEVLVGLCVDRSIAMIVGLLGILKAGGAYVPLDPSYPADRLALMIDDSRAPIILTQKAICDLRFTIHDYQTPAPAIENRKSTIVNLDADWPVIAEQPVTNPVEGATAESLAYVIYTSGSTGLPKGVMIEHRSLLNLVSALRRAIYDQAPAGQLRVSLNAPVSFDSSVKQIATLAYGHTLDIIPQEVRLDGTALLEYLRRHRIDALDCVPTQLQLLLAAGLLDGAGWAPRVALIGGEAIDDATWQLLARAPATEFYNLYGPTECTVDSTIACARLAPERTTIGRPLANVHVHILDRRGQPTPIGVPGELHIGGEGVGRGYLNRPELTAEKFIRNPFHDERPTTNDQRLFIDAGTPSSSVLRPSSNRMYKTGDLARWRPDGTIEFLGRGDEQVKLRGFRIELGEIEAVLNQHPLVRKCVVADREDVPGAKQLVAYVVPKEPRTKNQEPDDPPDGSRFLVLGSGMLRDFLKQRLPDYMLPSAFVLLDDLPLTPNGKVDRRALPAPSQERRVELGVAPRTALEQALAATWAAILPVEAIGIHDNFFDLGGHSLLAAQLVARVRQAFGVDLPLRSLFEAPTVAGLAEKIEPALATVQSEQAPPILLAARDGDIPLAYAQERLWFLDQFAPGSAAYNIPIGARLYGPLDPAALEQSVQALVQRHESLRTSFTSLGGRPIQRIAAHLEIALPIINLCDLPAPEREARAKQMALEEARRPFDLREAPLLRAQLLRVGEQEHLLVITIHHIVFDGWSRPIFFRELSALYQAFVKGRPCPLEPLPIQYADFAIWQRQQGEAIERQIDYWKGRLSEPAPALELPTDRPRPPMQTFRGARQPVVLSKSMSERLKALADQEQATLFMTLFAAFNVLLYRYTGQVDILIGTPIANRSRAETEGLIGYFVNTLALRTDLSGNPTYRALLRRVREIALAAYTHQDVPFERLIEVLQPERDASRSVLFQAMFAFQHESAATLALPEISVEPFELQIGTAKFDLTLAIQEAGDGLRGSIEYNSDLFDAATIERMAGHLATLIEGIAADPDRPIAMLPLLSAAERRLLLGDWNATDVAYPRDQCIHELFEAQAARTPDALALVCGHTHLTYRELDWRANQLGHYLQTVGVGPDVRVAICIERSVELVISLLGILKAGAAYVPLDPAYPKERLAIMLADSQASVLLTQSSMYDTSADKAESRIVVNLDAERDSIARMPGTSPASRATAEDLAYLIYTSGSTGRPKGVAICHRSTVNLLYWARQVFSPAELSGVLAGTSICFDLSVFELFVPLSWGGTAILAEDVLQLTTLPAAQRVTLINTVPSAIAELLRLGALPTTVRTVNLAGESLQQALVQRVYQQPTVARVVNLYGPTETTTYSSFAVVLRGAQGTPPIGRPVANTQIYLLDQELQPVPIGVPGELYIGGDGLARGYRNRPELTAEKFIPNPFTNCRLQIADCRLDDCTIYNLQSTICNSERLYKTGDLARWRSDGNIEYLGRIDQQVKLRGFRIELEEIAAVLSAHPLVRENVVVVREDVPGAKRMVAYVVPTDDRRTTNDEMPGSSSFVLGRSSLVGELRDFLKQRLPDYMIPAAFVSLDALPLTLNGKVDRRALPALDSARPECAGVYVAPRTPAEEMLARVWPEVLGLSHVGVHDNFFALGGDSLLSIQIVSRANQAGLRLTVKQVFQHQTIAELAAGSGTQPGVISEQGLVTGQAPLTPNQRWFFDQRLPAPQHWNMAMMLETPPDLDTTLLEQALQQVLLHHDALRLRFVRQGSSWSQLIAPPDQAAPITRIDLSKVPEVDQPTAVEAAAAGWQASLNLSDGPLMRVVCFDLGARRPGRLLMIMHHLIADKLSYDIVIEDIQVAYRQLSQGEEPHLPPKTTSFKQWAERLAEDAASARQSELAYWLAQPWADVALLPVDYPEGRSANTEASAHTLAVWLGVEATRALLQEVPRTFDVQIMDVLLAALAYTLAGWAGSRVLLVEGAFHGRAPIFDGIDLSRTVGWLAVHPSILLDVRGADTPQVALQSIKAQLRRIPNYGVGQEILRYLSDDPAIRAQMQALPEPEVFFSFLGQPSQVSADTLLRPAREGTGPQRHPSGIRSRLLDCIGGVVDGQLQLVWRYSAHVHQRSTIETLAHSYLEVLLSLIAAHR